MWQELVGDKAYDCGIKLIAGIPDDLLESVVDYLESAQTKGP